MRRCKRSEEAKRKQLISHFRRQYVSPDTAGVQIRWRVLRLQIAPSLMGTPSARFDRDERRRHHDMRLSAFRILKTRNGRTGHKAVPDDPEERPADQFLIPLRPIAGGKANEALRAVRIDSRLEHGKAVGPEGDARQV